LLIRATIFSTRPADNTAVQQEERNAPRFVSDRAAPSPDGQDTLFSQVKYAAARRATVASMPARHSTPEMPFAARRYGRRPAEKTAHRTDSAHICATPHATEAEAATESRR